MNNMQNILEEYRQKIMEPDLFSFWQHENTLRQETRGSDSHFNNLILDNPEELELLYRAWYRGGRKIDFLQLLCLNLNRLPIIKWFTTASTEVVESFLEYLPWYMTTMRPSAAQMQFLVHIYRQEMNSLFTPVFHMLDLEQCRYLMDRTANAELRKQLKSRIQTLEERHQDLYFGWPGQRLSTPVQPGLYGDRGQILHTAAASVWLNMVERGQEPYGLRPFQNMLACSDLLFQCGMVEDSLAVLLDIYQDYLEKNRLVDLLQDEQIYKLIQRLLRRVVPMYAVQQYAPRSALKYAEIYKIHFPHFSPDPAAVAYLQLFDNLLSPNWLPSPGNWVIMRTLADRIHAYRPAEPLLMIGDWMNTQLIAPLQSLADQKKQSYPQETLSICLFITWLHKHDMTAMETEQAVWLFSIYREYWNWLPSRLFMNVEVWKCLAPLLDPTARREGERLLEIIKQLPGEKIEYEITNRPDLFKKKNAAVQRHILSGRFLGVY